MGMKVSYKSKDGFPDMFKRLKSVDGTAVEVGVLKGEHKWLAAIHEYGLDIKVTPAMRAYLHGQGLHLKDSTEYIKIPERSFLRSGFDEHKDAVEKKAGKMLADVASGAMSADAMYKGVGLELSGKIQEYAVNLNSPGNHPFTLENKGTTNPLIDSGDMIGGITWRKAK